MDWRRAAVVWAVGVLCGLGLVYAGGSDYEIAPGDQTQRDVEVARSRGWTLVVEPEGPMWRRPKALRLLGPPQYLENLR